jgi:type I restriction-modification system DNA methylase subunit
LKGRIPKITMNISQRKCFTFRHRHVGNGFRGRSTLPTIGIDVDDEMEAIEKDNPSLRCVLPKAYAQEKLDKTSLDGLVNEVSTAVLGTKEAQSKDLLGVVYEYFHSDFALAGGEKRWTILYAVKRYAFID